MNEPDPTAYRASILDPAADSETIDRLRQDPHLQVLDHLDAELDNLRRLRPTPDPELRDEPGRWAWYPWRNTLVKILGPNGFRRLRLDRNRNGITIDEQDRLGQLTVAVAGLSVGHVIAHTLAAQGLCGRLRLADFDHMELSNLNRVPATVFDLGVNKAVVAARRIAELDPYLTVDVFTAGLTTDNLVEFLGGVDVFVEECDSLDIKALARVRAKAARIPVVMATSDRGIVDVERFDLEPDRPILHGLLGELDIDLLPGMSSKEKMPHMLRHLEAERLAPRTAASLVELDRTLSTWPQLAADVVIGASAVAEAVRRIGLGTELRSGRCRVDVGGALDQLGEPDMAAPRPTVAPPVAPATPSDVAGVLAHAALRAPSGGNTQPWHIDVGPSAITIGIDPALTSTMDVGYRGSAVSLGAAVFNARVAAAAHGALGPVEFAEDVAGVVPLLATVHLGSDEPDAPDDVADLYGAVLARNSNRNRGTSSALPEDTVTALGAVAQRQGGSVRFLDGKVDIAAAADILAAADRARFLTPQLHREMISEMRWPGDPDPDTGIDVHSLGLDEGDLSVLEVLRRPDVMAELAEWDAGSALGDDMGARVRDSSALAVVTTTGTTLRDYAIGGAAVEAVWVEAQRRGLAVQPVSPPFLYAHDDADLVHLSERFADELGRLRDEFTALAGVCAGERIALILRLTTAEPAAVPSRRAQGRVRTGGIST